MSWTVTGLSGAEIAALKNIKITYKNQQVDEAVFELGTDYDGAVTETPVMVTVRWLTTTIFRGYIQRVRRRASGSAESIDLIAKGPWSEWERTQVGINAFAVVLQDNWPTNKIYPWYEFSGSATAATLLADLAGKAPSFAQAGAMSLPSFTPPYRLLKGVTVAQCIRELLKYYPRAVAFFDYSVNPPAFRVVDRATSVINYNVPADAVADYEYERVNEATLGGVVINYDLVVDVNDMVDGRKTRANSARHTDATSGAVTGSTNHLWYQIDIGSVSYTRARVFGAGWRVSTLLTTYGTATSAAKSGWIEFWNAMGVPVGNASVANTAGVITAVQFTSENDGVGINTGDWVWLKAPLPEAFKWTTRNTLGFVTANLSITQVVDGVERKAVFPAYRRAGAAAATGEYIYHVYTPSSLPSAPPNGAAARILADRNTAATSGRITLSFDEIPLAALKTNRWTLPNGTVLEPIQQLSLDIFKGQITAEFGQPSSLSLQDYIQLASAGPL